MNFAPDESALLASCWVSVSTDPISGNDQQSSTFWNRITVEYNSRKTAGSSERTLPALQCHWTSLSRAVSAMSGILNKLLRGLPSGWNDAMAMDESLKRFQEQTRKPFKFLQAFKILQEVPKFKLIGAHVPTENTNPSVGLDGEESERPVGGKQAKKTIPGDQDRDERHKQLAQAAEDLVKIAEEKQQIAEDQFTLQLFRQNPDSMESKEFMMLKRQEYLNKYKRRLEGQ
jgi:hypothetical protein